MFCLFVISCIFCTRVRVLVYIICLQYAASCCQECAYFALFFKFVVKEDCNICLKVGFLGLSECPMDLPSLSFAKRATETRILRFTKLQTPT